MNKYETWNKLKEPAPVVLEDGSNYWRNIEGVNHREFGPAVVDLNGYKAWYINGVRHREDGPAIIWADGHRQWYINGVEYIEEEFNEQIRNIS